MVIQRSFVIGLVMLGLVSLIGCRGEAAEAPTSTPAATATPVPTATATSVPEATATPVPAATPTPAPTATPEPAGEKISLEFVNQLSTAEEGEDIERALHDVEGILTIRGDEFGLTITYDPDIITPDEVRQALARIGHPVKE